MRAAPPDATMDPHRRPGRARRYGGTRMDAQHFDTLARTFAAARSRRGLLRALVGGALALVGGRAVGAQACRGAGSLCNKDANCCSNLGDTTTPDPFKRNGCACPAGTTAV